MMKNQEFNTLNWVEYIIKETFGNSNSNDKKDTILKVPEVKKVQTFFEVNYDELIVLCILIDGGIRQEELTIDAFLEQFGGSISSLKNIHDALCSLIAKGYVISTTKNKISRTLIKQTFHADEKVFEAILSNKPDKLQFKPAENFQEFLKHIEEILDRRKEGDFDADTVKKLIERELNSVENCKELEWIKSFDGLTLSEKTLFFAATIEHNKKEALIDLEYFIKLIEDNFVKQKSFRDSVTNKTSLLIQDDLLIKSEDAFVFDEFVGLTNKSINTLFKKQKKVSKKSAFETGTVLLPEDIVLEQLFYNDAEWKQINTIEKVLSKEKHELVVNQLIENKLGKGISILFNGYSGTGKTATAKQLAKTTNRALFSVDVEKVVEKWVGDSEKNVKKIFTEYYEFSKECELMPILFFNEDSIFSKRVEVGHSTDRTHNSMQNILLEQIELFTGISIVTSNHAEKLDKAFERRFLYRVEFQKPSKETQFEMIQNYFPNLTNKIILDALENYSFTGGQIYNIRKKYIMQSILEEDLSIESLFIFLCQNEIKVTQHQKIGFN